jgi:molybdopterin synthase catalytic subunit
MPAPLKYLIEGSISPAMIAESIAFHSRKTTIGAHQLFLGQVRADEFEGKSIVGIEFSAYAEMAEAEIARIREACIVNYNLTCAHVLHSIGEVKTGDLCFWVFVSSPHRTAAFDACKELVERIKQDVPLFGKELFDDGTFRWKKNSP